MPKITNASAPEIAARFAEPISLEEAIRRQAIADGDVNIARLLASATKIESYESEQIFIKQGDSNTDLFLILSGSVIVSPNGRNDTVRHAHDHVGEMAAIDPAVRRSATVRAREPTVVARISELDFSKIANNHPVMWRRLAMELGERLRQRASGVRVRQETPRVFVASSSEALPIARSLQRAMSGGAIQVNLWADGIFLAGSTNVLRRAEFAVILLSPDDRVFSRWTLSRAPRDNLILELGLFMGAIGRRRAIMVYPRGVNLTIPSDLLGVTPIRYAEPDMLAVAAQLKTTISSLGAK